MPAPPLLGEACAQVLMDLGGRAVEEVPGQMVTYLLPPPEGGPDRLLADAARRLEGLAQEPTPRLSWRWQPHRDWEVLWRRGLAPRRITPRIVVAPSWDPVEPRPGEIHITLDPGVAFGTAEHATTRGCLRFLDVTVSEGDRIVDVGAGSGILSIAAALLGAREVLALEVDELACEAARENLALNGVSGGVTVVQEEVQAGRPLHGAPWNGVVANLQTSLLLPLLSAFHESLVPDGWVILSGIQEPEREEILSATSGLFQVMAEDLEGEWWSGSFQAV